MAALFLSGCATRHERFEPWTDPALGEAILTPPDGAAETPPAEIETASLSQQATVEDYVAVALRRSPTIRAAEHRVAAAKARVPQVRSLEDPEVMVTPIGEMGEELGGMPTLMVGVSQEFPFPGKLTARAKAAQAEVEVARGELRAAQLTLARDVRQAYWRYYNAVRSLEVARQGTDLLRQVREAAEASYRTGGGEQEDVLSAGMELATLENELLTLAATRDTAAGRLNALLDRPLRTPVPEPPVVEGDQDAAELDLLLARAATQNAEIATMRDAVEAGRRDLAVARLERLPDFGVALQYNVVDESDMVRMLGEEFGQGDDDWWLTFSFNLPLWQGKYSAMEREARSMLLADLAELRAASNSVASELQAASVEAETQARMVRLFRDTLIPQARQALEASLAGYRAGRASFGGVMENWRRVLEYEQMSHQAHAELRAMLAEIDQLAGEDVLKSSATSPAMDPTHDDNTDTP